ncbi:MAG TPA: hypothetical protein VFW07_09635 [Parafilimonas sp.]|nr:hypothetical protein [Parafilimonas sp.]
MKTKVALTYFFIILFFLLMALVVWMWYQEKINKATSAAKKEYGQASPVVCITWKNC